jgi:modulator of drug activity B
MANVLIINGHLAYPFSQGQLNASLAERAETFFRDNGHDIRTTAAAGEYQVAEEIEKFKWADIVFLQTPLNWMGVPWALKKYIDEVWTTGMMGELSDGDGRTSAAPKKNYGLGPKLTGRYMMSVTGNAPREAFNNLEEAFFNGLSEDELLLPMHLNFKWIGLKPLPTFMAYDVMKNPEVESDFRRFDEHLALAFCRLDQDGRVEAIAAQGARARTRDRASAPPRAGSVRTVG